ncbi:MAG: glycosyltransferase family 4 protein [Bacteroidetes bacterium]|nr:glycosyltransferase family 4 protein [Bacteroidota bacterium]
MNETGSAHNKLIAFVSNSAWSLYNFRMDVIRCLLRARYRILVIAPNDEYSKLLINEGCYYVPLDFNNRSENPLQDYKLFRQLKKIYKEHKPDFIFHYVIKPNIYGSLAAASLSIKSIAVITGLGYSFAKNNWLYRIVRLLYKRALKKTEFVWFLNNEDAKMFINEKIVPIEKMKVLPGEGVNTEYFSLNACNAGRKDAGFTFLMSTRLLKSKGISIYADAARILKRKGYNANFQLIGFFEKHHPDSVTENELKKWESEGLIKYSGFAKDVRPFLVQADCFVFPSSYNEGVPKCLMEAASMELPVITSFNRGCKEVVLNNSNGFICNINDPFDLADKMERMINLSIEERSKMGKNGRALVMKKFNVTKIIEEYISTLKIYT